MTTITQADRDAAASWYELEGLATPARWVNIRNGLCDENTLVELLAAHREAAEKAGARKWQDIATAPYNTPVIVEVGCGMSFAAQLVPDASMNSEDQFCDQWRAVHQGEHPPCWSDGACWVNNENDVMSMQPRRWRALDPEEIVK